MKFLCDVHISFKVVRFLESRGFSAVHVNNILEGDSTSDQAISKFADENDLIVLTKDGDFRNSHFISQSPLKLIKVSLGNISTKKLIAILENQLALLIDSFENDLCCIELFADRIEIHSHQ